tara:strand:+ start:59 stop:499 length:441 start_codon:yes stop_codon:yes gene_type:complete
MSSLVSSGIKNILMNGINLNLESVEEEQHYLLKLLEYFDEETEFTAYLRNDGTLDIETKEMQLGMQIQIINSTLYMVPYQQDVFEIFTSVLQFISSKHREVVMDFRGQEENKIQSIEQIRDEKENYHEKTEEIEEESSSDDDYEWI